MCGWRLQISFTACIRILYTCILIKLQYITYSVLINEVRTLLLTITILLTYTN